MRQVVKRVTEARPGLTATALARRAGINRSTLHRISSGTVEPTVATLRELAVAQGLDLSMTLVPLSDPDAAAAARYLLDETVDGHALSSGMQEWITRLERLVPESGNPFEIVRTAGRASTLLHRDGAVFLRGDSSALRLASAGDAAGGRWAVSGRAAIVRGRERTVSGPSVLWVDDVDRAAAALSDTHKPVSSPLNAQVVVAHADPLVFIDAYSAGPVRYVAPIQMLLDCVGLGGELEGEAESIARGWSE